MGAGRIGSAYARMMCEGHKCNIIYHDPYQNKFLEDYIADYGKFLESKGEPAVTCTKVDTVEELLQTADVSALFLIQSACCSTPACPCCSSILPLWNLKNPCQHTALLAWAMHKCTPISHSCATCRVARWHCQRCNLRVPWCCQASQHMPVLSLARLLQRQLAGLQK